MYMYVICGIVVICHHTSSQQPVTYEANLAFNSVLATKMGPVPAERHSEHMKRTQAKSHDSKRLLSAKRENTQQ